MLHPDFLPPAGPNHGTSHPATTTSCPASGVTAHTALERTVLSATTAQWFGVLANLHPAVHLGCTPVAQLGIQGPLAPVRLEHHPVLPQSDCGRLQPNLAEHATLSAVQEAHPAGILHALEVRDARGRKAHRIVVPAGAGLPAWQEFTRAHAVPPTAPTPWFPANHSASARRVGALSGRVRFLRQRLDERSPEVRRLTFPHLVSLLQQAIASELAIRTTLYNRAVILGSTWIPEFQAPDLTPSDDPGLRISRFFGSDTGLQLHHDPLVLLVLWTGVCSCCGKEKWAIEVGTPEGELALALTAPDESQEEAWRGFLTAHLD